MKKYQCKCCENYTLSQFPNGTFEICPVCYWEDDNIQSAQPNFSGGANEVSLFEAKKNFLKISASDKKFINLVRQPFSSEIK